MEAALVDQMLETFDFIADTEAATAAALPAYAALLAARAARAASAARAAGGAGAGAAAAAAPAAATAAAAAAAAAARGAASTRALLAEAAGGGVGGGGGGGGGGATRALFAELSGDASLFRFALLPPGASWSSLAGAGGAPVEPFLARLPHFAAGSAARGCNTLVLRAVAEPLPDERVYIAVSVGAVPPGTAPAAALAADVLAHVCLRVDPPGGGGGGAPRHRVITNYKAGGVWPAEAGAARTLQPAAWPLRGKEPFFLRVTLGARGAVSYVDGAAIGYSLYGGAGDAPPDAAPLHVLLPLAGDAAEKASWRVLGAWWGWCDVDAAGAALAEAAAKAAAARAPRARREPVPDELFVTGLRPGATEADVLAAFAALAPRAARVDGATATVALPPGADMAAAVAATDCRVAVLGATVNVRQSARLVQG
jgi:hypothetical protein